jgi:hypothetical protein
MIWVRKSAIGQPTSHGFTPVLPTRRVRPEVLDQLDESVSGLPLKLKVLKNKVEGGSVPLVEREAIRKPIGVVGHAFSIADLSRDGKRSVPALSVLSAVASACY